MSDHDPPAPGGQAKCDPDLPGDLSIVVQGGLTERNLFETANAVRHWRTLFPAAQIVLALSGTTILASAGFDEESGSLADPRLAAPFAPDRQMNAALAGLRHDCDVIVMARATLPLPPIKSDTLLPNNVNLQIAAAQAGLGRIEGRYVLRVRADLVFLDRGFLDQYSEGADLPRGDAAVLRRRVLISWLYTLDPFAEERLPLHFSDWFHFGLREDVVRLWNVPDMSLEDAVFYQARPHAPHSNVAERLFHTRLAVEQHLLIHGLCPNETALGLHHHNDLEPAVRSMHLLADNFVLCDMAAASCVFPKYAEEFYNHRKRTACVTPGAWRALVAMRHIDPRIILSDTIGQVHDRLHHEFRQGFPRRFPASQVTGEIGTHSRGTITARGSGVVARGPRMRLPPGEYLARLEAGPIEGDGVLRMIVTTDSGTNKVGEAVFGTANCPDVLVVPFQISRYGVEDVEILCRSERLDAVTIHALAVVKVHPRAADLPLPRFVTLRPICSAPGRAERSASVAIRPGRYVAAFDLPDDAAVTLSVMSDHGVRVVNNRSLCAAGRQELRFDVTHAAVESVTLSCAGEDLPPEIGLAVARRSWAGAEAGETAFPRFYDAPSLHVANGAACDDRIVTNGQDGVLCYGPYADLTAGRYIAQVHIGGEFPRLMTIAITGEIGTRQVTTAKFDRGHAGIPVTVPFEIGPEGMTGVEVVCSVVRPGDLFVSGLTLFKA